LEVQKNLGGTALECSLVAMGLSVAGLEEGHSVQFPRSVDCSTLSSDIP